jgi:hypothetical protein
MIGTTVGVIVGTTDGAMATAGLVQALRINPKIVSQRNNLQVAIIHL